MSAGHEPPVICTSTLRLQSENLWTTSTVNSPPDV